MTVRQLITLASATVFAVASCMPSPTTGPVGSSEGSPGATSASSTGPASLPTQTETDFGRIWDATPPSLPIFPGAAPATDPGEGPASAILAIDGANPAAVAAFYRDALGARGLLASVDGPLEDGAVIVSASDGYRCEAEVDVRPAGTTTLIVVLYGAGCPFE